jgi:predicted nucleotidyltransferase
MMTVRDDNPNLPIMTLVARALGDLCESLVFVGGCSTGLLVTSVRAQPIRMTQDVDLVAEVATARQYHAVESRLQAKGFHHDLSAHAPICRWVHDGVVVDLMPSEPGVLGFRNRWYPLAVKTAQPVALPAGIAIRLISAPVFLATKLEAFKDRGRGDFLLSHDLEDVITVVIGRDSLLDEVRAGPGELRNYLAGEFAALVASDDFLDALAGHLPGDAASQRRLPELIARLRALATIERGG